MRSEAASALAPAPRREELAAEFSSTTPRKNSAGPTTTGATTTGRDRYRRDHYRPDHHHPDHARNDHRNHHRDDR